MQQKIGNYLSSVLTLLTHVFQQSYESSTKCEMKIDNKTLQVVGSLIQVESNAKSSNWSNTMFPVMRSLKQV